MVQIAPSYGAYYAFLALFVTYLVRQLTTTAALNTVQISLILASTLAPNLLVPLVVPALSRWLSPLTVMRWSIVALLMSYLSAQWIEHFALLWAAYTLVGLCLGLILPVLETLTLQQVCHRYGQIRLWGSLGFILSVAGCGYWIHYYTIDSLAALGTGLILAMLAASYSLPIPAPYPAPNPSTGPVKISGSPAVYGVLLITLLWQISMAANHYFLDALLQYHGYTSEHIGLLIAWGTVCEVVLFAYLHRLIQRFGHGSLILISLALTAVRWLLIYSAAQQPWVMVCAQSLHAFAFAANHGLLLYWLMRLLPTSAHLLGQSLFVALGNGLGLVLGSLLAGWLWHYQPTAVFSGALVCTILAALVALYCLRLIDNQANTD